MSIGLAIGLRLTYIFMLYRHHCMKEARLHSKRIGPYESSGRAKWQTMKASSPLHEGLNLLDVMIRRRRRMAMTKKPEAMPSRWKP